MVTGPHHVQATLVRRRPIDDARDFCLDNGLELSEVSAYAWLIRTQDRSSDLDGLIGCIEERGERFELMQIGSNFQWSTFDSLLSALEHLVIEAPIPRVNAHVPLVDPRAWTTAS
jgi:hypothetical protein